MASERSFVSSESEGKEEGTPAVGIQIFRMENEAKRVRYEKISGRDRKKLEEGEKWKKRRESRKRPSRVSSKTIKELTCRKIHSLSLSLSLSLPSLAVVVFHSGNTLHLRVLLIKPPYGFVSFAKTLAGTFINPASRKEKEAAHKEGTTWSNKRTEGPYLELISYSLDLTCASRGVLACTAYQVFAS
jgi:hypothetical protein